MIESTLMIQKSSAWFRRTLVAAVIPFAVSMVSCGRSQSSTEGKSGEPAAAAKRDDASVVRLSGAGDHVELEVRDTGTGIPNEELPNLFKRFHRVRVPLFLGGEFLDDVIRRLWRFLPKNPHDFPFGIGD